MSDEGHGGGSHHEAEHKIYLFLAYFGLFSLIPFLVFRDKRSDPSKDFVYWHARQGVALAIVVMCLHVLMSAAVLTLSFASFLRGAMEWGLWAGLILFSLVFTVMGWVKAFSGQRWVMPLVGRLAGVLFG